MTDTKTTAVELAAVTASIRAELARADRTAADARRWLQLGETAWRTRQEDPGQWRLRELVDLAGCLGVPLDVLLRGIAR
jgi:hypothetical protein